MPKPCDIWPDVAKFPDWLDLGANIPKPLARILGAYTPHRDGWVRWEGGKTIFVCGKRTPLDEVEARWQAKRQALAEQDATRRAGISRSGGATLAELVSAYLEFADACVQTGRPKRLSPTTVWDYQRILAAMLGAMGPLTMVADLGPAHFAKFAATLAGRAPSRYNSIVANVETFVGWALSRGYLANNAILQRLRIGQDPLRELIGYELVKLPADDLRDHRLAREKSFTPDEIRALWNAGNSRDRLWIALGINGALDNADISNLTTGVIDLGAGRLDYRRRKRGKVRRLIPLHPLTLSLLARYLAVHPAPDEDTPIFRTKTGLALQRLAPNSRSDSVAYRFRILTARAGLRQKPTWIIASESSRYLKFADDSDGRGFRALRTTFANLAPPGFRDEVEIIMGHSRGSVLLDHYIERYGFARLGALVDHVMHRALACAAPLDGVCPGDEASALPAPLPWRPEHMP